MKIVRTIISVLYQLFVVPTLVIWTLFTLLLLDTYVVKGLLFLTNASVTLAPNPMEVLGGLFLFIVSTGIFILFRYYAAHLKSSSPLDGDVSLSEMLPMAESLDLRKDIEILNRQQNSTYLWIAFKSSSTSESSPREMQHRQQCIRHLAHAHCRPNQQGPPLQRNPNRPRNNNTMTNKQKARVITMPAVISGAPWGRVLFIFHLIKSPK
jgi:hypothetical protein